jgi:nucleoside-diphosphate-sugar epimerase
LKFIISFSNKKIEIIVCDKLLRSNDNLVIQSDISKIDKLIGWKPKYAIKDTIRSIYEEMETENEEN